MRLDKWLVRFALVGVLALSAAFAGGCAPSAVDNRVRLTPDAVVGVWRSELGGQIEFQSAGNFTASNIRNEVFDDNDAPGEPRSGSGSWQLEAPLADPSGPPNTVRLRFGDMLGNVRNYVTSLRAEKSHGSTVLVFYIGDPDVNNRYVFRKQ